ncbi:unnamed protein product (macronuclear) [Paramecium tetraurelia]|uniref:Uncharacterized protein n=1 Tax=Paramecium tetraurelia TaxID=5888 RepID=A0E8E0_PARTE|nr:uncharacterized protein GSPATT00024286001 [Paramecium tetraurelia]CAK91557.1 unnamed protein product [Paramecium tetraurelia]|eukprot:XP_001458954.1 hypothetical protein (macronuclear) [Paramecium tetraurelia strain d4-2]
MSNFLFNHKTGKEEKIICITKPIRKEKRRNQYTIEFKFGSDIDVSKLKQVIQINQQIPAYIPLSLTFRLESDIFIPIQFDPNLQLGALSIDPISFNYRIVRYDKHHNNYIFHFEPIDRPFTPHQVVKTTLEKYHPSLGELFEAYHFNLLKKEKITVSTEEEIKEYENSIRHSFAVYIQKKQKGIITTLMKSINTQYLQLMGINDQIFQDYINQTGLLPWCLSTDNNQFQNLITGMFQGAHQQINYTIQALNYNGQQFEVKITPKVFHIYNQEDDSYLQFMFFEQEYNSQIMTQNQIDQNMIEYFNQRSKIVKMDFIENDYTKRCKYRKL